MRSDAPAAQQDLDRARRRLGLTYQAVAHRAANAGVPIDLSTCYRVIKGEVNPTARTLYGIALALELHELARGLEGVLGVPQVAA